MNIPNPTQTPTSFVIKLETSGKSARPVKLKPFRKPVLKSIVLFEKVNSFRREKGDLPGTHARLGL
jgi:hypothetical protein